MTPKERAFLEQFKLEYEDVTTWSMRTGDKLLMWPSSHHNQFQIPETMEIVKIVQETERFVMISMSDGGEYKFKRGQHYAKLI